MLKKGFFDELPLHDLVNHYCAGELKAQRNIIVSQVFNAALLSSSVTFAITLENYVFVFVSHKEKIKKKKTGYAKFQTLSANEPGSFTRQTKFCDLV